MYMLHAIDVVYNLLEDNWGLIARSNDVIDSIIDVLSIVLSSMAKLNPPLKSENAHMMMPS